MAAHAVFTKFVSLLTQVWQVGQVLVHVQSASLASFTILAKLGCFLYNKNTSLHIK